MKSRSQCCNSCPGLNNKPQKYFANALCTNPRLFHSLCQWTVTGITHRARRGVRSLDRPGVRMDITATGLCVSPALDLLSLARQAPYCLLPPSLHFLPCPDTRQRGTARDPPSPLTVSLPDFTFLFVVCVIYPQINVTLRPKPDLKTQCLWLQHSVQQISWWTRWNRKTQIKSASRSQTWATPAGWWVCTDLLIQHSTRHPSRDCWAGFIYTQQLDFSQASQQK